ncbi:MAG: response regulator transcription factor [Rhodospirillaceae bacterium]
MEHILVVEDEASLRIDLADFLSVKGYAVSGAATVTEARAHLLATRFDAVILDIGLPDGSGFDILAEIRSRKLSCGVVMLTAFTEADGRVKGPENGADADLVKKATLREVEVTLRSVLRHLWNVGGGRAPIRSVRSFRQLFRRERWWPKWPGAPM